MATTAIKQPSLVDQVESGLAEQIASGHYPLSSMLPSVRALAETWGVSKTVMREALARLAASGYVRSHQGLGFFVSAASPPRRLDFSSSGATAEIARMIEIRVALETEAAGLASIRRSKLHLKELSHALAKMAESLETDDAEQGLEADLDFHKTIARATGNSHFETLFALLADPVAKSISLARENSRKVAGQPSYSQQEHQAVFSAILAEDADLARLEMRRHVENTAKRLNIDLSTAAKKRA